MPKIFTSETQKTGEIGESVACRYFEKHGYKIIERNYTRKWGEIDIVAEKGDELHFIEVKCVSRNLTDLSFLTEVDTYRPEDNMHPWKQKRLSRTIQTYLLEHEVPDVRVWQFDLACVYLDLEHQKAKIKMVENIIL